MKLIVNGKTAEIGGGSSGSGNDRYPIDFVCLDNDIDFSEFPIEIYVSPDQFYIKLTDRNPGDPVTGLMMDTGGRLQLVKGEYKETVGDHNAVGINVLSCESTGLSAIPEPPDGYDSCMIPSFVREETEDGETLNYYEWVHYKSGISNVFCTEVDEEALTRLMSDRLLSYQTELNWEVGDCFIAFVRCDKQYYVVPVECVEMTPGYNDPNMTVYAFTVIDESSPAEFLDLSYMTPGCPIRIIFNRYFYQDTYTITALQEDGSPGSETYTGTVPAGLEVYLNVKQQNTTYQITCGTFSKTVVSGTYYGEVKTVGFNNYLIILVDPNYNPERGYVEANVQWGTNVQNVVSLNYDMSYQAWIGSIPTPGQVHIKYQIMDPSNFNISFLAEFDAFIKDRETTVIVPSAPPQTSITSGTEDLTAGTSTLATGSIYLVYE